MNKTYKLLKEKVPPSVLYPSNLLFKSEGYIKIFLDKHWVKLPPVGLCSQMCLAAQLCLTLQHHGLKSARLLCTWDFPGKNMEWITILFSRRPSRPRDRTQVSCIAADALPSELPGKPDFKDLEVSLDQISHCKKKENWAHRDDITYPRSHRW